MNGISPWPESPIFRSVLIANKEYAFWICTLLEFAPSDPAGVVHDKGGLVGVAEFESAIDC